MSQSSPSEGNRYDKIFKENTDAIILPLLGKLLQADIKILDRLSEKQQTTIEREVDFLARVLLDGEEMILHVEYQTTEENNLIYRFAEYHGILLRQYEMPIRHVMIYLGNKPFTGTNRIKKSEQFVDFDIISPIQSTYQQFLNSDVPEEVIMTILADFKGRSPEAVFRLIFKQLKRLRLDEASMRKYLNQLGMLSRLRKLDQRFLSIKQEMPIIYDITQDEMYLKGLEKGEDLGLKMGIEKGEKIGQEKEAYKFRYRIIKTGLLYGLPIEVMMEQTQLSKPEVQKFIKLIEKEQKDTPDTLH